MRYNNIIIVVITWIIGFLVFSFLLKDKVEIVNFNFIHTKIDNPDVFIHVFLNNSIIICVLFFGLLSSGTTVLLVNITNSIYISQMFSFLLEQNLNKVFLLILPHTILELIAILIASNVGLKGVIIFKKYLKTNSFIIPKRGLIKKFIVTESILIIAGICEVWSLNYINQNLG